MNKEKVVYLNPFQGRSDGVVFPGRRFDGFDDKTISEGYEKEIVKKTGDGEDDFLVEKKLVVYRTYDRDKYIQDQSDDVGILNILKKVALSGADLTENNPYMAKPGYVDMTEFPQDLQGAQDLVSNAKKAWEKIPVEVKGSMSYEDFIKSDAAQKLYDYYSKLQVQEPEKGGKE